MQYEPNIMTEHDTSVEALELHMSVNDWEIKLKKHTDWNIKAAKVHMGSEINIEVCQYCFPSREDWAATVSLTPFIRHAITTANGYQEIVGNFALTTI